jgi:hypothetical protein
VARHREAVDVYRYGSYAAILKKIATPPVNPYNRKRWQKDFNNPNGEMIYGDANLGLDCWNELSASGKPITVGRITEWLMGGWPAGVERIRKELGQIKIPTLTDIRRKGRWTDSGDELSVDRLYSGDVDRCWRDSRRGVVHRPPPLHLFSDISVNCNDGQLFWRGAVTCAFAEAAVAVGHKVCIEQVINIEGLTRSGSGFLSVTRIKDYNVPLNPAAMAAIAANTASLRLTDFGHCVQIPETIQGYGSPTPISVQRLAVRGVVDERAHTLLVPQTIYSKEGAIDWANRACADLERRVTSGQWSEPSPELGGLVSPQVAMW